MTLLAYFSALLINWKFICKSIFYPTVLSYRVYRPLDSLGHWLVEFIIEETSFGLWWVQNILKVFLIIRLYKRKLKIHDLFSIVEWNIFYSNYSITWNKTKIPWCVGGFLWLRWSAGLMFNATFNNISVISWWSVLLVEETGGPRENHRPIGSHWQTLSHNIVSPELDSNSQRSWC